ncbi:MAG: phosphatase domain-containing protein [Pseudomonadota bacterium]
MPTPYPLDRSNDRRLPDGYDGSVLIWDIDKTYLNTHFSTWRGLLAIPFEFAVDKDPIPGAVQLLQGLRHGPEPESRLTPLYFVSASPPELRHVLERRMVLDGVQHDGISFKDQLALLKRGRIRKLVDHTGYKLTALLLLRREISDAARWFMFGDDAEDDAAIFALFNEICAGLRADPLAQRLRDRGTPEDDAASICQLASDLPRQRSVERIFIHRIRRTPLERYQRYDGLVTPTENFFETALHLVALGQLRPRDAGRVGREVLARGAAMDALAEVLLSLGASLQLSETTLDLIRTHLF